MNNKQHSISRPSNVYAQKFVQNLLSESQSVIEYQGLKDKKPMEVVNALHHQSKYHIRTKECAEATE